MVRLKDDGRAGYKLLAAGETPNARVVDVEENSFNDPQSGDLVDNLRWKFALDMPEDPELNGKEVWGNTSTVFTAHPNCKSFLWVTAIMGSQPDVTAGFDTDTLIGKRCRVLIEHRNDKQGRAWMKVKEVLPPSSRGTAVPPHPEDPPF